MSQRTRATASDNAYRHTRSACAQVESARHMLAQIKSRQAAAQSASEHDRMSGLAHVASHSLQAAKLAFMDSIRAFLECAADECETVASSAST
jgi:hypothetical protein